MRLIDADKLIERIIKGCNGFHPQAYHTCKYDIVGIINQCDTDYDVDKVVEQLEEAGFSDKYSPNRVVAIVKAGGKNV